ncbi:MAG: RES family NAD+ phosphorylase [Edaphobacter sp.]
MVPPQGKVAWEGRSVEKFVGAKLEPIPECYADSQQLAATLLAEQSNGVVYPSVRHKGGTCIVCFRPTLVYNVRRGVRLEFGLLAGREFEDGQVREVRIR